MQLKQTVIYVGSPYSSGRSRASRMRRVERVVYLSSLLMVRGFVVHSPMLLVPTMEGERQYEDTKWPHTAEYWHHYSEVMLRKSNAFIGLLTPGWRQSSGLALEMRVAKEMGIPSFIDGWGKVLGKEFVPFLNSLS